MDYCTDQPQWASGGYIADSKISTQVVNGSQQQYWCATPPSAAGRTACGTRCSPASRRTGDQLRRQPQADGRLGTYTNLPTTPLSPREALPVRRFRRRHTRCSCRPRGPTRPASAGRAATRRAGRSRCRSSSSPGRPTRSPPSTAALATGQAPAAHPRRLRHRAEHPDHPRRHRRARPGSGDADRRWAGPSRSPSATSPACGGRRHDRRRHRQLARADDRRHRERHLLGVHDRRSDHPVRRVHAGRRAARRQDHPRPGGQQRRRADRPHLARGGRPRRAGQRRLGRQPGRRRARRERRQRHRHRAFRRALAQVQRHLERRERQDGVLPERTALRPAEPAGLAVTTASATPPTRSPTRCNTHELWAGGSVHLHQRRPVDPPEPRLRGAGHERA